MKLSIVAIIPARSGSKGLINKNILPLNGHPLIAYSIKAARDSELIDRVIVNTDSVEIAKIAESYGAEIPFIRPDELAEDYSLDFDVFHHCLKKLSGSEGYMPDYVVQLRPTSPIRTPDLIDNCIKKIQKFKFDSLRVVTESPLTPYKMWNIGNDGELIQLINDNSIKEPYNKPRQKLPKTYWQVGALDVIKASTILDKNSMTGDSIMSYIIPQEIAIDIDDMKAFKISEELIKTEKFIYFEN
jgi:CMP-N,N'-diacetyllegionaminic acid synthase